MKIRNFRRTLCAGALAIVTVSNCLSANPVEVPLPESGLPALNEIVKTALSQSPRILAQNLNLLHAEYQEMVSASRLYPQVGGSLQYNYQGEDRADIPDPQNTEKIYYNFSASQPVWHWGSLKAGAQIGEIGKQIAEHNLDGARRSLAAEVRDAYLGLIVQKMGVRNALFGEKIAKENLNRQEVRFKAEEITMGMILEHRLRADEASLLARRSVSDFAFAIKAFRRLTGVLLFAEADIPDGIPLPAQEPEPAPLGGSGYLKAESLLTNELQIEQERLQEKINKKTLWPKFNAVIGISQDELSYTSNLYQRYRTEIKYVGLQIYWSVFDGFASRGYRLQGLTRLRQLENTRSEMLETLKNSADQQAAAVGFAWSAYKNAALRQRFAMERLGFESDSLARGQSSDDQVAAAQVNAYQAEVAALDALAKFYGTSVRYASTMRADPLVDGFRSN